MGRRWKIILINEYPKSGATWLKQMLGELLYEDGYFINKKKKHVPIIKPKYFIQRHWLKHTKNAYKVIIVIRDPRDAYNSFYFYQNYYLGIPIAEYNEQATEKENMHNYLKEKLLNPKNSNPGFSYKDFYQKYIHENDLFIVKYEDLRKDTFNELKKILAYLGYEKEEEQIKKTIEKFDFKRAQQKEKEANEKARFVRKGIAGDWKNNFSEESIKLVKKELGSLLIEMGYEKDENW